MTGSPDHAKTAVRIETRAPGRPIAWREVLGAVQDSAARSEGVQSLTVAGHTIDGFATVRGARETVLEWLVRCEDRLEPLAGSTRAAERERVRGVRRRLEVEVWP